MSEKVRVVADEVWGLLGERCESDSERFLVCAELFATAVTGESQRLSLRGGSWKQLDRKHIARRLK